MSHKPTLRARFTSERRALKNANAVLLTAYEWGNESRILLAESQVRKRTEIYLRVKAEWEKAGRPMDTGYRPDEVKK